MSDLKQKAAKGAAWTWQDGGNEEKCKPFRNRLRKVMAIELPKESFEKVSDKDKQELQKKTDAVNNAIAHRNYSSGGSIQIEIYRDRVEVINPGRLHAALTIKDLYKKHESYPPNARIAHALYQVRYIEALGTGITDLLARCKKAGLKRPLLEEASGKFRIVLWRKDSRRNALRANVGLLESLIIAKLRDCTEGVKFADLQQTCNKFQLWTALLYSH